MKTKSIILFLSAVLFCTSLSAQSVTFTYSYDSSGNRIKRELKPSEQVAAAMLEEELELEAQAASISSGESSFSAGFGEQQQDAFSVLIYPNPSTGYYTVELPELQSGEQGSLQVFSMSGKPVLERKSVQAAQDINISGSMPGYYLLRITVSGRLVVKTLIKK